MRACPRSIPLLVASSQTAGRATLETPRREKYWAAWKETLCEDPCVGADCESRKFLTPASSGGIS
jgi:hypothetical protein